MILLFCLLALQLTAGEFDEIIIKNDWQSLASQKRVYDELPLDRQNEYIKQAEVALQENDASRFESEEKNKQKFFKIGVGLSAGSAVGFMIIAGWLLDIITRKDGNVVLGGAVTAGALSIVSFALLAGLFFARHSDFSTDKYGKALLVADLLKNSQEKTVEKSKEQL